jgi:hypothetical protein
MPPVIHLKRDARGGVRRGGDASSLAIFVAHQNDTALDLALFLFGLALPGAAVALLCNERWEMALLTMLSVTFFIVFCLRVSGF